MMRFFVTAVRVVVGRARRLAGGGAEIDTAHSRHQRELARSEGSGRAQPDGADDDRHGAYADVDGRGLDPGDGVGLWLVFGGWLLWVSR